MYGRPTATTAALAAMLAGAAFAQTGAPVEQGPPNVPGNDPAFENQTRAPAADTAIDLVTRQVAGGLEHPWGIAVLPGDAGYLVTERPGRLRHISPQGEISEPIAGVPDVLAEEQGGLLDVALAPDFEESRQVYLTYAAPLEDGMSATAAALATLSDDMTALGSVERIFLQEPPSPTPMHYGSRVLFGPDGHVFVTTGEHFTREERDYAQDLDTTYGKVVRLNADGSVPEDNPFTDDADALDEIWTLGHRNIQGAAIRPETGQLWVIEHGPQGGDELNLIEAGANYGWPVVTYGQNYDGTPVGSGEAAHAPRGFTEPRYYWDPVIAPGGMTFYQGEMLEPWSGDALIAALVAPGVVRLELDGDTVVAEERLATEFGRVRDVAVDTDGSVLFVTDFPDGGLFRLMPAADTN